MSHILKSRTAIPRNLTVVQIDITTATTTAAVIAAVAAKKIRIWEINLTNDGAMTVDFQDADGNSFTDTQKWSTLMLSADMKVNHKMQGFPIFELPTFKAFQIVTAGTNSNIRGWISYSIDP